MAAEKRGAEWSAASMTRQDSKGAGRSEAHCKMEQATFAEAACKEAWRKVVEHFLAVEKECLGAAPVESGDGGECRFGMLLWRGGRFPSGFSQAPHLAGPTFGSGVRQLACGSRDVGACGPPTLTLAV